MATVSYAITVVKDALVATVFSLNSIGCLVIVGFTVWKRIEACHWVLFQKREQVRRYLQLMSPEERRTYRQWKATWVGIYVAIAVLLASVSSLIPAREVAVAQNGSAAAFVRPPH